LYSELAKYYDAVYWYKDYDREVDFLLEIFQKHGARVRTILEVACGTGNHAQILTKRGFEVTGVDISKNVLEVARKKVLRRASFFQGDMRNLDEVTDREFDAVICLFSAISYNLSYADLGRTVGGFYSHLRDNGVAVFDTHFTGKGFVDGYRDESAFDDGSVIGARICTSKRRGNIGELSFTYLIKDGRKVIALRDDVHRLGLFDSQDFLRAMKEAGFIETRRYVDWTFKPGGKTLFEDEIYVGVKPRGMSAIRSD